MALRNFFRLVAIALLLWITYSAEAHEIELLDPKPLSRQVVDALRGLEKSPYQTLRAQFDKAREPEDVDLGGWRTGRCYFSDRPLQAVASVLTTNTVSDDGPAFRGSSFRKVIPFVSRKASPSFFDHMSSETREKLSRLEARYRSDVAFPVRTNASLRSFIPRSMTIQARSYELRRRGRFLLMKVSCEDNGGCFNDSQTWAYYYENEDLAYCYFFRS